MHCCPKCKSENGWSYVYQARCEQIGGWGEDSYNCSIEATKVPKTASCIDCGARVPINQATGLENYRP